MSREYTPNHIPHSERIRCLFFSIGLLTYGTVGVMMDDLYIPGKRSRGLHLHGVPCWIMYGAFLCAILNLISVVVDHYDERNNERNYHLFARLTKFTGWGLAILAAIVDIFIYHQAARG